MKHHDCAALRLAAPAQPDACSGARPRLGSTPVHMLAAAALAALIGCSDRASCDLCGVWRADGPIIAPSDDASTAHGSANGTILEFNASHYRISRTGNDIVASSWRRYEVEPRKRGVRLVRFHGENDPDPQIVRFVRDGACYRIAGNGASSVRLCRDQPPAHPAAGSDDARP